jgi:hypothetical protein
MQTCKNLGFQILALAKLVASCQETSISTDKSRKFTDADTGEAEYRAEDSQSFTIRQGGRASVGDATAEVPPDAVAVDATVTIRRVESEETSSAAAIVLESGSEAFEITLVDTQTGSVLRGQDLLLPLRFTQIVDEPSDRTKVELVYVAPAESVDGKEQHSGSIANQDLEIETAESSLRLSSGKMSMLGGGIRTALWEMDQRRTISFPSKLVSTSIGVA